MMQKRQDISYPGIGMLLLVLALFVACGKADERSSYELLPAASPITQESLAPRLSVDERGRIVLSWLAVLDDERHALRFAIHDGDGWSDARTVAEGRDWFANWADTPGVRPVGDWLFAHWLVRSGPGTYHYNIHAAWSSDGGKTWEAPFILHGDGRQAEHGFLSSVVLPTGELGVSWLDGRHTMEGDDGMADTDGHPHAHAAAMSLRWARLVPGERQLRDSRELDGRVCDCCMTTTILEPRGPRVFYRNRSTDELRDIHSIHPQSGEADVTVSEDEWRIAACPVNGPHALRQDKRTLVAWYTAAGGRGQVRLAVYNDGESDGPRVWQVDAGQPLGRVRLLGSHTGDARLLWLERSEGGAALMMRGVGRDDLGEPIRLTEADGGRTSGFPVAVSSENGSLLAWTSTVDGRRQVQLAWLKHRVANDNE